MNKILAALAAAITFVLGQKDNINALKKQVSDRDEIIKERDAEIKRLVDLLDAETLDDAALGAAVKEAREKQTAAETRAGELETQRAALDESIKAAEAEADKLTDSINVDPDIAVNISNGVATATAQPEFSREFKPPVPKGAE